MRRLVLCASASLAFVACVDLFHSTDDFHTACENSPDASGCHVDGQARAPAITVDAPCSLSPSEAAASAERACAWLGACESPVGGQQFSACMTKALAVFNCSIAREQHAKGKTLDLWSCLTTVDRCEDVRRCLVGEEVAACEKSGSYVNCLPAAPGVRFDCVNKAIAFENCAVWGQTCVAHTGQSGAQCGGSISPSACMDGCISTALRACVTTNEGARDEGFDCALRGAGRCESGQCLGTGDACTGSEATCSDGVATLCVAARTQKIDCGSLGMKCREGALTRGWDPTSACYGDSPCTGDRCSGATLYSCTSSVERSVDCGVVGLGKCTLIETTEGTRGACGKP